MATTSSTAEDINVLSYFLANQQIKDLSSYASKIDVIVICASAVLHSTTTLFNVLASNPSLTPVLLLCGGVGHSTPHLYSAVAAHPVFKSISGEIKGLAESQVLLKILETFYDIPAMERAGCRVLVEDRSTNCGANAVECKRVLDAAGVMPQRIVLNQDPTMSVRTKAGFERVYADGDLSPEIICWPGFVPTVKNGGSDRKGLEWDFEGMGLEKSEGLWDMDRFLDLVMGEIPRLRAYGPEGLGSIVHVDVPRAVEDARKRLNGLLETKR